MRRLLFAAAVALIVVLPSLASEPGQPSCQDVDPSTAIPPLRMPLRVEGEVKPPELISRFPPEYPETAKQAGITGKVVLQAIIDEQGDVEGIEILRTNPMFDEAAVVAVRKWKYKPATLHGQPVAVFFTVIVKFDLPSPEAPSPKMEPQKPSTPVGSSLPDPIPNPSAGTGRYYLTTVTYQGQTRAGRRATNGVLRGRDSSGIPACVQP